MNKSYLNISEHIDYDHPIIQEFIQKHTNEEDNDSVKSIALYYAIRDGWRYNPMTVHLKEDDWKASKIISRMSGHCLDKAILLVACLRAVGIPARLHLAKVKNHIGVEKIIEKFGNDELTPHGMVDVYINNIWLKVSPAFNKELCEKLNVEPLEFDGENDSLFQEYSKSGSVFMEYIEDYGHFEDVPLEFIFTNMQENYGSIDFDSIEDGIMRIT